MTDVWPDFGPCLMKDGQCRICGAVEAPRLAPDWFIRFHNWVVRLLRALLLGKDANVA